jgi:hypothetical protein
MPSGPRSVVLIAAIGILPLICMGPAISQSHEANPALRACITSGYAFEAKVTQPRSEITGVRANIEGYKPLICSGGISDSVTSTMLAAASAGDPDGSNWAQVGYGNFGENDPLEQRTGYHTFMQVCTDCDHHKPRTVINLQQPGGDWDYRTVLESDFAIHFLANGHNLARVDTGWTSWASDWKAEWFAEVHNDGDNIVGNSGNPVNFNTVSIQRTNHYDNWIGPGAGNTIIRTASRGFLANTTGPNFEVWTDPL